MEVETPGEPDETILAEPDPLLIVQQTLESMMSKKHLVKDPYLAGSMNPQMYIPMQVLIAHERLQKIGATEEQIVIVASRSTRLGFDDCQKMVRPLLKSKRNVIILRDIPADTVEEEIRGIFADSPYGDAIREAKPEVNNCWFLKFTLDDVQDVVLWLRSQKFKDEPVNAAIKSEHFLRSFFPVPGAMPPIAQQVDLSYAVPDGMQQMPQQGDFFGHGMQPQDGGMGFPPQDGGMGFPGMIPLDTNLIIPGAELNMGLPASGFWQPWGARMLPPPLIFTSTTTLSSTSVTAVAQQAEQFGPGVFDNLADLDEGSSSWDKSGGGCKGSSGWDKGGGKGSSSWQQGGGWDNGGGWENGGGWGKGNDTNWQQGGGWEKSNWDAGGWGGGAKSSKGKDGPAKASEGYVKPKWAVRKLAPPPSQAISLPTSGGLVTAASYTGDFRKYTRAQIEEISKAMHDEVLTKPESFGVVGEIPIFRAVPSVALAAA